MARAEGRYRLSGLVFLDWYLRTGVYPLHSVIALRSELVERDPELPSRLYTAFVESKKQQVTVDPTWTAMPRLGRQRRQIAADPVPYGVEVNDTSARALVTYSRQQGLLDAGFPTDPRQLFAEGDYPDA